MSKREAIKRLEADPLIEFINRRGTQQDNVELARIPLGASSLQSLGGGELDPVIHGEGWVDRLWKWVVG